MVKILFKLLTFISVRVPRETIVHKHIKEEILRLTQELIRIPSTHSRPEEIRRCAEFIEKWLCKYNINFVRHDSEGIPSLSILPKNGKARILLVTHFDVVETDDTTLFTPEIKDGKLFGRGAIDDKYGIALSLILFREHLRTLHRQGKYQDDMVFGLLLTGDEEVGGSNGTAKVIDKIDTDFFIVLDGGNPEQIVTKEKGILLLQMDSTGKSAHAARPWLGQNSFDNLVSDYLKIKGMFPETTADHWHKTMVLSQSTTGNESYNMVPKNSSATLDIRYTEEDDPDEIIASISKTVSSTITVKAKEPLFYSGSSVYLDLLRSCTQDSVLSSEHGASDARYFSQKGIPGVIWGADGEMSQHTDEEHVVVDSIYTLYNRLDNFLSDIKDTNTSAVHNSGLINCRN